MGLWYSVTVKNETPYTWHYSNEVPRDLIRWHGLFYPPSGIAKASGTLRGGESEQYWDDRTGRRFPALLNLRYGVQREVSFSSRVIQNTKFTIKESWDRSLIELHCDGSSEVKTCPNYAKIEEDRIRQQQQEEQKRNEELRRQEELRRLERLEQEKRIEEQINRENETARRKLSEAWSKINLNLGQGGQERHHQHTHVVQQAVDDHAGAIEWDELNQNLPRYAGLVRCQKSYEEWRKTPGQYAVIGGAGQKRKKTAKDDDYKNMISEMKAHEYSPGISEYDIAVEHDLGYVGPYEDLKNTTECERKTVEKDHFIPTDTLAKARKNVDLKKLQNSKLYDLVKIEDKNLHLAMQVLYQDHRIALTTGRSSCADKCRALLADTLLHRDAETLLKQTMIMANPISSQMLRTEAGIKIPSVQGNLGSLTEKGTNCYYKCGYMKLISKYQKMGIIDQNAEGRLKTWVKEDQHLSKNTPEYNRILKELTPLASQNAGTATAGNKGFTGPKV
ncbi:uncharacterized protein LOC118234145 isoform X2 [Anguilla anguilla]|uniref:uncharacterized protein LOC118234145 isoform X2 n=1 Tax=Anguilla anguilla TaxID=7936 RepID=UPI0015A9B1FE|nr:uncharacterized protein LOC118234145 isoform X2 [Anguilla anguilla]